MEVRDIEPVALFRDQFLTLMETPLAHDIQMTRLMLSHVVGSPACLSLVAVTAEGKIVGLMLAEVAQSLISTEEWVVGQRVFYVDPIVRGQGIGRYLVQEVEAWAKERGVHWVVMTSRHGHVPAEWFETQGYTPIERTLLKRVG